MASKNIVKAGLLLALLSAVALFAAPPPIHAQTSSVTAEVDSADPTLYDTVTLTVTVTGENNIGAPVFPTLSGLQIVGRKINSQQSYHQGRVTAEFRFIIEMRPRHTGTIVIGPVRVPIGGDTYETAPITLNVTQGVPPTPSPMPTPLLPPASSLLRPQSQFNQGDPSLDTSVSDGSFFIESEVDNDAPYLGEQITYRSKFYASDPFFIRPIHRPPDFVGFWNPDRTDRREYPEIIEGNGYSVIEFSTIVFPTIAGDISIEPSTVGVPGGVLSSSFQEYASPPVELQVKPLPSNEPASFTGAVGKFEIEANLDTDSLAVGESLTLTVEIEGQGNFDTLPDPVWRDIPGWRAFENDSVHRSFVQDGVINGAKTFQRVLVPDSAGDFDLPPIEYSYFDPEIERYVTASTQSVSVHVAPDPNAAPIPEPVVTEDGAPAVTDIRHIKPAPRGIGSPSDPTQINPVIWGLGALPFAALLASFAWRWSVARREAARIAAAPIRARREALARMSDLGASSSGADAATAALHGYLSVILGRSSSSLPITELEAPLRELGVTDNTIQQLMGALRELDQSRFAPQWLADEGGAAKTVAEIVRRMEREIQT